MNKKVYPIFLISLPRSGSTFLQKILMSHPQISSTSEPWILLPLVYMREEEGVNTEYGHRSAVKAFSKVTKEVGESFVDFQIRDFAESIYSKYCKNGETYFLDKTPRYYHILGELARIFPNSKFVVLVRNPISVFASSVEAFRGNSMRRLDHLDTDFFVGPEKIGRFAKTKKDNIHLVRYEDLVAEPDKEIEAVCRFLRVDYHTNLLGSSFNIKLDGYGDHLGARQYKGLVRSDKKWGRIISTLYRKRRLKKYIRDYPQSYIDIGGYCKRDLFEEIEKQHPKKIGLIEYCFLIEEYIVKVAKKLCRLHLIS